jgi:hypothetical protein
MSGLWSALTATLLLAGPVSPPPGSAQRPEEERAIAQAQSLLSRRENWKALSFLKEQARALPGSRPIQLLLGASYLRVGNDFWAIRTFGKLVETSPADCEARLWLAWAYLRQAALDRAWEALGRLECDLPGPLGTRYRLMRALVAEQRRDRSTATTEIERVRRADAAYESDRRALSNLIRQILPHEMPDLTWRVELGGGYTTNALMGSPTDAPAAGVSGKSPVGVADVWLQAAPDFGAWLRPSLEVATKSIGFSSETVSGYSYVNLTGRLGFVLGRTYPRVLVGYRPDYLLLGQGDRYDEGPMWFYFAHRGEVEVEVTSWLTAFAGSGRRTFRDLARTRTELDGGLGGRFHLARPVTLLWAVSGRTHHARSDGYNLAGASALLSASFQLPLDLSARVAASLAADWYPDSDGYFQAGAPSRRDLLARVHASFWSPSWQGFRLGLTAEWSNRDSSVGRYTYADFRTQVGVLWTGEFFFRQPAASREVPLADPDWHLAGRSETLGLRIQDLLRQDEQIQRGSTCVR